jgi:predicted DNA-binding transcriptional regulator AlpA
MAELLGELSRLVAETSPEELPTLVGQLEAAKAVAWARMMRPSPAEQHGTPLPERNLSATETARRLGVSKEWVYRNAQTLPFAVKIGRRVLFSERGLERWNRQRRV